MLFLAEGTVVDVTGTFAKFFDDIAAMFWAASTGSKIMMGTFVFAVVMLVVCAKDFESDKGS